MSNPEWHVACPHVGRLEESRVVARDEHTVTVVAYGEKHTVPRNEYERRAACHATKHEEQLAKFQQLAPAPWLGWGVFWLTYIRGFIKHGAFRNPLEAEARRAEGRVY